MSPALVAHRGASRWAPENTFPALRKAVDMDAQVIEFDIRESADGVLYVMHDEKLDRTTDGTGPFHALSSAEIDALDAGRWFGAEFEGTRVPQFDAYLDAIAQAGLEAYAEVKWCDCDRAAAIIREAGMQDRTFTFSFEAEMRAWMRRAAPEIRHMVISPIARNVSVARALHGADMIELHAESLRAPVVQAARDAGLQIMAYSNSDDPKVYRRMFDLGIDYINHDHLDLTNALRSERG
ncbi:glycerophosphodiester phosphodiesterase [Marinibacterium profundimaris]|uniref:GP-PDE domain-containing protein n=1 Tax=Marinibacterium profundimaris TaxID=1679460 RepID=A0A225NQE0_9RHOB|nr:glycerophosphodiester phosphodiesterase family protein [Marinibacterium profundimaris]OWU74732.1 hypothetical protein ATO3_08935 [Marinibacterium profundimaris]